MSESADVRKLGQSVENLASTIIEIIESRLKQFAEEEKLHLPDRMACGRRRENGGKAPV